MPTAHVAQRVSNLAQTAHNQAVLDAVMRKRAIHRVANFGGSKSQFILPLLILRPRPA